MTLSPANRIMHTRATRWTPVLGAILHGMAFAAACALIVYGLGVTP